MQLHRTERDWYIIGIVTEPALTGTWQASFDNGTTWIDGTATGDDWSWLIAGPDFDATTVGLDPDDTKATISRSVLPQLRLADNPVLDVEYGARISLV